ncbi:MAG: hypothetical protein ABI315_13750 [Bacteroidia bacterium]
MTDKSILRIKAKRLGTISEVTSLLIDLEIAYNSIQAFHYIIKEVASNRNKNVQQFINNFIRMYVAQQAINKSNTLSPSVDKILLKEFKQTFDQKKKELPNLLELKNSIEIDKIIPPDDRLYISKVIIEPLGFWEVIGSFNALEQIRGYLKDRHERKKHNKYQNTEEVKAAHFEIEDRTNKQIIGHIHTLKSIGYSDEKIKPLVTSMLIKPLEKLGMYQDTKQIEGPIENIIPFFAHKS